MLTHHAPRNRLRDLRMKDGKRWTLAYRHKAWKQALEEARHRSVLSSFFFTIMAWIELSDRKRVR